MLFNFVFFIWFYFVYSHSCTEGRKSEIGPIDEQEPQDHSKYSNMSPDKSNRKESDSSIRRRSLRQRKSASSSSADSDSDNDQDICNLLSQSRSRVENVEALRVRHHLLRPEDYVSATSYFCSFCLSYHHSSSNKRELWANRKSKSSPCIRYNKYKRSKIKPNMIRRRRAQSLRSSRTSTPALSSFYDGLALHGSIIVLTNNVKFIIVMSCFTVVSFIIFIFYIYNQAK